MELFEALFNRRSIRKYTNKYVEDELLVKMIESAMFAPSAVNKQPWHFMIFRDKKMVDEVVEANPNAQMLATASAGILICYDSSLQHDEGFGPVDCSAATQNMLLAAHGLGLGACWIGVYPRVARVEALHKVFELPEHVLPFAVISVGYAAEEKSMPSRFNKDRIHIGGWQKSSL